MSTSAAANSIGWRQKVLLWDWHQIALDGYPGWDLEDSKHPPFVRLAIKHKTSRSSSAIASEFDDVAEGNFYCRDWTADGSPSVVEGEVYWTGFWFQKRADRDRFIQAYGNLVDMSTTID